MKRQKQHKGGAARQAVLVPRPILTLALKQPLLRHLLPTNVGYYPKAKGQISERENGCTETIFIFCADGDGWCKIAGQHHKISKNQLLVISSGTPYVYGAGKKMPWTIHWFHTVGSNVPHYLERLGVTNDTPIVSLGGDTQLYSLFREVRQGLQYGFTTPHLIYAAHALAHLLGLIMRYKEEFWQGEPSTRERISKSMEFMQGHLHERLNIATLAAGANLSRSHYTSSFQRVTGYAPLSYLNHLRMQTAAQLLNSTDWSIKRIGEHIGFPDQLYFSRAFKKKHSHSPSEHRHHYGA